MPPSAYPGHFISWGTVTLEYSLHALQFCTPVVGAMLFICSDAMLGCRKFLPALSRDVLPAESAGGAACELFIMMVRLSPPPRTGSRLKMSRSKLFLCVAEGGRGQRAASGAVDVWGGLVPLL